MLFQDVILCVAKPGNSHKVSYLCCVVALCMLTVSVPFVNITYGPYSPLIFTIDSSTSQNVSTIAPFRPPSHYQLSEKQMFQAYSIVISDALLVFSVIRV